jgi:hypothetical protein
MRVCDRCDSREDVKSSFCAVNEVSLSEPTGLKHYDLCGRCRRQLVRLIIAFIDRAMKEEDIARTVPLN